MINRIACVINKISTTGGAERVMTVLCNEFANRNKDVTLIVQESMEKAYPLDDRVKMVNTPVRLRIPALRFIIRLFKLRTQLKKCKPDVIISFMTEMNIATLLMSIGLKVPVIVSERIDPRVKKGIKAFVRKLVYPLAKGYVFQTENAMNYFSESIREKSTVIANPLPNNLPVKTEYEPTYEIISVGRLESQKNHEMLIKSFYDFKKTHKQYKLKIYGTGSYYEKLNCLINEFALNDSVSLMGSIPEIADRLKNSDIFVLSSDFEGMPNSLAEAMAIGLPCISTDCPCGGPAYLIQNMENGILIPVNDKNELTKALCLLAGNRELAYKLGNKAKEIREKLSVNIIVDKWLEFCEKIVGGEHAIISSK